VIDDIETLPVAPLERKSSFTVDKPSPLLRKLEPHGDTSKHFEPAKAQKKQVDKQQYARQFAQLESQSRSSKIGNKVRLPRWCLRPHFKPGMFKDYPSILFDRLGALIKGYLTRRLVRTERVQILVKTISVSPADLRHSHASVS
jgi:hypothetical protein